MLTSNVNIGGMTHQMFKRDAQDEKGEMARLSALVGAIAISDLVKTTLGPRGMVIKIIIYTF